MGAILFKGVLYRELYSYSLLTTSKFRVQGLGILIQAIPKPLLGRSGGLSLSSMFMMWIAGVTM